MKEKLQGATCVVAVLSPSVVWGFLKMYFKNINILS